MIRCCAVILITLAACGQSTTTLTSGPEITSFTSLRRVTLSFSPWTFINESITYTKEGGNVTLSRFNEDNLAQDANRISFSLHDNKRKAIDANLLGIKFKQLKPVYTSEKYGSMASTDGEPLTITFNAGGESISCYIDTLDPSAVPQELIYLFSFVSRGRTYFNDDAD